MFATIALAALLAPAPQQTLVLPDAEFVRPNRPALAIDLRPMTEEDRVMYPGRERFDKTEWYESQMKSVQTVIIPNNVDEWKNNGLEIAETEQSQLTARS